jgi:hypothetical protein
MAHSHEHDGAVTGRRVALSVALILVFVAGEAAALVNAVSLFVFFWEALRRSAHNRPGRGRGL